MKGDFQVRAPTTDDPAEVGSCDFVLFCVKTFDTEAAAARLGPLVGEGTAVVSLQNGVENEEKLARMPLGQGPAGVALPILELQGCIRNVARPAYRHQAGPWTSVFEGKHRP